jgi:hypothetical protein
VGAEARDVLEGHEFLLGLLDFNQERSSDGNRYVLGSRMRKGPVIGERASERLTEMTQV